MNIDEGIKRLSEDLDYFCEHLPIVIKAKTGELVPFKMNSGQRMLHDAIEKQLKEEGRVRAVVVKARQMGFSTYVSVRNYWKTLTNGGRKAYILAHNSDSSNELFAMTKRMHDHNALLPLPLEASNAKELIFSYIDSSYKVGTAGSEEGGRGFTIQSLHGSEVSSWPHAEQIAAGLMEAVPRGVDSKGSEVILESTGKGVGTYFHKMAMGAAKGENGFILVFVPWFVEQKYREPVPEGFVLTDEERKYKETYALDDEQIMFRRLMIAEKGKFIFEQEYPSCLSEAFQDNTDSYLPLELVREAQRRGRSSSSASPVVMGIDPSYSGKDRSAIVVRRGYDILEYKVLNNVSDSELAIHASSLIDFYQPVKVFIDFGGDSGCYAKLRDSGYGSIVERVAFGGKAIENEKYANRKAEMLAKAKEWLTEGSIPNDEQWTIDLCAPSVSTDNNGRMKVESKDSLKKRGYASTDILDAFSLTFAAPVRVKRNMPSSYSVDVGALL